MPSRLLLTRSSQPPSVLPPALSIAPTASSAPTSASTPSSSSTAACFQEALQLLYQKHTTPVSSAGPSRPPISTPPFESSPLQLFSRGHRKRCFTDEVEGPQSQDAYAAAAAAVAAVAATPQHFPRRQSESGLYRLAERSQRHHSGEQMTLKRVHSEHQSLPFSMLGQQQQEASRQPFSFTMVLGEQVSFCCSYFN